MSKRKDTKKQYKILDGHKRVGKRFIPPLMQLPLKTSTNYLDHILPELIWIGLINEQVGYVQGARIIEKVFLSVNEIKDKAQQGNFALISNFGLLNFNQKEELIKKTERYGILNIIRDSIAPLILLYDACPLSFFGPPETFYTNRELISLLKNCVGKIIDKYDTPAVALYGALFLFRLVTKTIKINACIELPDFNAIIHSPGSEEANHAAGLLRSFGLTEFVWHDVKPSWAKYFWNRGFELSQCEFEKNE